MRTFLLVVALALPGCVEDPTPDEGASAGQCADNFDCAAGFSCEGGQCVRPGCQSDDDCSLGFVCIDARCSETGANNGGNNGGNNNGNNGGNNNGNPPSGDCRSACQHLLNCSREICILDVVEPASCELACAEQGSSWPGEILGLSCEEVNQGLCQDLTVQLTCLCGGFGTNETNAGDPCTTDAQCQGGSLQAVCITEINPDTQEQTDWEGGYCTAANCQNDEQCGTENICVQVNEVGDTFCFHECNPFAPNDCRSGYACLELTTTAICIPRCDDNDDCLDGESCNGQTGLCE